MTKNFVHIPMLNYCKLKAKVKTRHEPACVTLTQSEIRLHSFFNLFFIQEKTRFVLKIFVAEALKPSLSFMVSATSWQSNMVAPCNQLIKLNKIFATKFVLFCILSERDKKTLQGNIKRRDNWKNYSVNAQLRIMCRKIYSFPLRNSKTIRAARGQEARKKTKSRWKFNPHRIHFSHNLSSDT